MMTEDEATPQDRSFLKNGTGGDVRRGENVVVHPKRTVLRRCTHIPSRKFHGNRDSPLHLRLMMLGCEDSPPYGPAKYTAGLLLELIFDAKRDFLLRELQPAERKCDSESESIDCSGEIRDADCSMSVSITVYECDKFDYPTSQQEWESYHGVIIPGSFSHAHDNEKWILHLKRMIRDELHPRKLPTLGLCFGHQIYAHAFDDTYCASHMLERDLCSERRSTYKRAGCISTGTQQVPQVHLLKTRGGHAERCPEGIQIGPKAFVPTLAGMELLLDSHCGINSQNSCSVYEDAGMSSDVHRKQEDRKLHNDALYLLYTHGDMVSRLPPCALPLGGTPLVPIQAAAYFASAEALVDFQRWLSLRENQQEQDCYGMSKHRVAVNEPRAQVITLQGHPEFSRGEGFDGAFRNVLSKLGDLGEVSSDSIQEAWEDACKNYSVIRKDSLRVVVGVGRTLGWI